MEEAGVTLVGGHSVEDPEFKYGLSVTGVIHPDRVIPSVGARLGDGVILTKPLGTGIISTALKAGALSADVLERVTRSMGTLNRIPSEIMQEIGVSACTDVTGFGLIGHACEMVVGQGKVGMALFIDGIPFFPETECLARMGMIPGGAYRNRDFYMKSVEMKGSIPEWIIDVLFDPQTSGGLLICISPERVDEMIERMRKSGIADVAVIGEIVSGEGKIVLTRRHG